MLLTEDEIGIRAGLPGPVVAELLQPHFHPSALAGARDPQYCVEDALRVKIAAYMFAVGIRWRFVQAAIAGLPDDQRALRRACRQWAAAAAGGRGRPVPRRRLALESAVVTALMALAFLVGLLAGWTGVGR